MSLHGEIVLAHPRDTDVLSRVIALSFHTLAPSAWLIPDEAARRDVFPGYFRLFVEDAMARGCVYTTADRSAAALWFPVDEAGAQAPPDYDPRLAAVTGRWVDRFRLFDELLDKHHPTGLRHTHLAILAVHPDLQRQGIGTALLSTHHSHIDDADPPPAAYLEASDSATRGLYLKHGYTDHGDPIQLPGGPQMFPMLRSTPRPAKQAAKEPLAQLTPHIPPQEGH